MHQIRESDSGDWNVDAVASKSAFACEIDLDSNHAPLLLLDANALVSPFTRALLIAGVRADGLLWTWSSHVEVGRTRPNHAEGRGCTP